MEIAASSVTHSHHSSGPLPPAPFSFCLSLHLHPSEGASSTPPPPLVTLSWGVLRGRFRQAFSPAGLSLNRIYLITHTVYERRWHFIKSLHLCNKSPINHLCHRLSGCFVQRTDEGQKVCSCHSSKVCFRIYLVTPDIFQTRNWRSTRFIFNLRIDWFISLMTAGGVLALEERREQEHQRTMDMQWCYHSEVLVVSWSVPKMYCLSSGVGVLVRRYTMNVMLRQFHVLNKDWWCALVCLLRIYSCAAWGGQ